MAESTYFNLSKTCTFFFHLFLTPSVTCSVMTLTVQCGTVSNVICHCVQLATKWVHDGKIAVYQSMRDLIVGVMGMGIIGKEGQCSLI